MEDIINRGGGILLIRVYNSLPDDSMDKDSPRYGTYRRPHLPGGCRFSGPSGAGYEHLHTAGCTTISL